MEQELKEYRGPTYGGPYYDIDEVDAVLAEKDKQIAQLRGDLKDLWDDKHDTDKLLDERNTEIAELKEERRWRKFPEEKPEDEGDYLVMARYPDDNEPHVETCFYDRNIEDFGHYERRYSGSGNSFGGFDGEEWLTHYVTFWMPLPKAPEEA